ncbi:hypothetical protein H9Q72_009204 [Fusarium xylarioides]|uniref:Uncharacterized protein n=1 Tax=Fusarium xylarioides TaxID=221167 RepID=A0A9P7HV43_9HYPO|nr:hypothetical protein H9Q72_009204 [Fusarium xylarioides]
MGFLPPRKSGRGSGQGGFKRAGPGHDNATPDKGPRRHQQNREAAEHATRQAIGEPNSQQSNNFTNNNISQAGGSRDGPSAPNRTFSGGNHGRPDADSGWSSHEQQIEHKAPGSGKMPLALVAKSSQTQVADNAGAVASRMETIPIPDGNSHHWYSDRPGDLMWGETCGGGVDDLIEGAMRRTGATSCQFFVIPNNPGRFDRIAAKAFERTWEDNNGYNDKGKPAGILQHGVKIDSEMKKPTKCAACGRKGHEVATCFSKPSGRDGAQVGCPQCNTTKYHGGDCKEIAALPLPEQVKMLVCQRANMTPFKGEKTWWKLLHEYCISQHFTPAVITALPWSKEFTYSLAKSKRIAPMQTRLDTVPGYQLPGDPDTASPDKIYWKYWEPNNLVWPPVLGQIPSHPSPMDTDDTTTPAPQPGAAPCTAPSSQPATSSGAALSGRLSLPPGFAASVGLMPRTASDAGQNSTHGAKSLAAPKPTTRSGDGKNNE